MCGRGWNKSGQDVFQKSSNLPLSMRNSKPDHWIPHYITLRYVTLRYVTLHHIILYYILSYCIILYYIALYNVILYYIILYYIILCYIILYYTILYYIISYCNIQYSQEWEIDQLLQFCRCNSIFLIFAWFCYGKIFDQHMPLLEGVNIK